MKNKWPDLTRRVASDEFTITVNGQDYHPHAGEYVLLRQRVTPACMQAILEFWAVSKNVTRETAREYAQALQQLVEVLSDALIEWNWTGPDGNPYPMPSKEVIRAQLTIEEVSWLTGEVQGNQESGNPTMPSPSSSTDKDQ